MESNSYSVPFLTRVKAEPKGMLGLVAPSVFKSSLARVKWPHPTECTQSSPFPPPQPSREHLLALASAGPILACPTILLTTIIPALPSKTTCHCKSHPLYLLHFPHCAHHFLFISLQYLVLFIALSHRHKNGAQLTAGGSINFR